jgi:hypothetical protein
VWLAMRENVQNEKKTQNKPRIKVGGIIWILCVCAFLKAELFYLPSLSFFSAAWFSLLWCDFECDFSLNSTWKLFSLFYNAYLIFNRQLMLNKLNSNNNIISNNRSKPTGITVIIVQQISTREMSLTKLQVSEKRTEREWEVSALHLPQFSEK